MVVVNESGARIDVETSSRSGRRRDQSRLHRRSARLLRAGGSAMRSTCRRRAGPGGRRSSRSASRSGAGRCTSRGGRRKPDSFVHRERGHVVEVGAAAVSGSRLASGRRGAVRMASSSVDSREQAERGLEEQGRVARGAALRQESREPDEAPHDVFLVAELEGEQELSSRSADASSNSSRPSATAPRL